MILFDSNVLIDLIIHDPVWFPWSNVQFQAATLSHHILINPIIYAEIAPSFPSKQLLDTWAGSAVYLKVPLPFEAGWVAAQAFKKYRAGGGTKTSPLPDFYIGAHAEVENLTLVTRDAARYRTYFPGVNLICPP